MGTYEEPDEDAAQERERAEEDEGAEPEVLHHRWRDLADCTGSRLRSESEEVSRM